MKKRFRFGAALLALLLCASLAAPAMAASGGTPEITWLTLAGEPINYIEELGWLTLMDPRTSRFSCIDLATGERVEYDYAGPFCDGLAMVMKYGEDGNKKYGHLDKTGTVVIPLEYDWAYSFFDGLALVRKDGKYGYIDTTGAVVVPLEYDDAGNFSDGLAVVFKYDADGSRKYSFIDKTGTVVSLEYNYVGPFSDGLAKVQKQDADGSYKNGYIDRTGAVVIPLEYDSAEDFSEGLARVEKDREYGYIDTTGAAIPLTQEYDAYAFNFSDGLAYVMKVAGRTEDDEIRKYGFIDKTGSLVIPLEYDRAYNFTDGLAPVMADGKYGFIDKTGAVVVPLEYYTVGPVYGGENDTVRFCYVQKSLSYNVFEYGIFENPYYVPPEAPSDPEPGNTEPVSTEPGNSEEPRGESPAPSSPGGQNTQNPQNSTNPDSGNTSDSGGGFPIVPVAVAVVLAAAAGAAVAVVVLKKKKTAPEATSFTPPVQPPAGTGQTPGPVQPQAFKFCPKCGTKATMDTNFCPKCGNPLESGKG